MLTRNACLELLVGSGNIIFNVHEERSGYS